MKLDNDLKYLYLDLNSYFASVEQEEAPSLRGKPVIVVPSMTDYTCAIAASYEAKDLGIKTGTMVYEAKKICPEIQIVQSRPEKYTYYHQKIISVINKYLPINEILSIDEVSCRLIGSYRIDDNAFLLASKIKKAIKEEVGQNLRCSIGISTNKYLAKIASNIKKPDGLEILKLDQLPDKISHWNLSELTYIGPNTKRKLNKAGIYDIKTLWNKSREELKYIWGSVVGQRYWYNLHGYETFNIPIEKRSVGHSKILEPSLRDYNKASQIILDLAKKASYRCRRMNYYASLVEIKVIYENRNKVKNHVKIIPSCDDQVICKSVNKLWKENIRNIAKIKKVSITLGNLIQESKVTRDLFQSEKKNNEKISKLIDSIQDKYQNRNIISIGVKNIDYDNDAKIAFSRVPDKEEYY